MALGMILFGGVSVTILFMYIASLVYAKVTCGQCRSQRDLRGKTVIVTGANTGIGLETSRDLARRNARVILACRSMTRGQRAAQDIINTTGNTNIVVEVLDLASFQSVRAFAENILVNERRLDVLVNNAGVSYPRRELTDDGLELVMTTNHHGHFLLTNLLLPLLKRSAPSRIVIVSSIAYDAVKMDFDNLNGEKYYNELKNYSLSKLCNLLFMLELNSILQGSGVTVNALHPGFVKTDLIRHSSKFFIFMLRAVFGILFKNAKDGAQTSIYVAVAEELEDVSGKYFSDCQERPLKSKALDRKAAERLWAYSEKITKLNNVDT